MENVPFLGDHRRPLVPVAQIVDQDAAELAVAVLLPDMKGQAILNRRERACPHDIGDQIRPHFGELPDQFALQVRREVGADEQHEDRHHRGQRKERPKQPPRR